LYLYYSFFPSRNHSKCIHYCKGCQEQEFNVHLNFVTFTTVIRLKNGFVPTQPPIQWVPGGSFPGGKRPEREAEHSPHLVPRSKNEWIYTSTPQYAFMAWCSVKAQGQLYLYLLLLKWLYSPMRTFASLMDLSQSPLSIDLTVSRSHLRFPNC
jgi:hypothetical protein